MYTTFDLNSLDSDVFPDMQNIKGRGKMIRKNSRKYSLNPFSRRGDGGGPPWCIYLDAWRFLKKIKPTIKDKSAATKFEFRPVGTTAL